MRAEWGRRVPGRGPGAPQHLSLGTMRYLMGWEGRAWGVELEEAGTLRGLEPRPSSARCATTNVFCFFLLVFSQTQR